jgi:hypothetical protein
MFIACVLSFAVGYAIGAFRVGRYVNKELRRVSVELEQHRKGLEQFYSKLDEPEKKGQQ